MFDVNSGSITKLGSGIASQLGRLSGFISQIQRSLDLKCCRRRNRRALRRKMSRLRERCIALTDTLHYATIDHLFGGREEQSEELR